MDPLDAEANVNAARKEDVILEHTEHIVEDEKKHAETTLTRAQIRRFMAKVDVKVLPMLGLIYAVSIIDRINIGSAKVLGMQEDLNLGTQRYSIVLMLFFPGYVLADVPANWILTKIEPRWWLPALTFCWGAVLCGMGFIHNWSILAFCRFLLGCLEGGVLPGVTFTIACWYTRQELHKRISCAYALGIIASALAGILSYGLGSLGGVNGMNGWRWIFSIEGGMSMAIGLIAPFFVPKFPDHTKWIKPDERVYLYNKLDKDRGAHTTDKVTWSSFVKTSKDWTLWAQGTIYCFNVGTANATAFFTPTIIKVS
jgi:MFS family permease